MCQLPSHQPVSCVVLLLFFLSDNWPWPQIVFVLHHNAGLSPHHQWKEAILLWQSSWRFHTHPSVRKIISFPNHAFPFSCRPVFFVYLSEAFFVYDACTHLSNRRTPCWTLAIHFVLSICPQNLQDQGWCSSVHYFALPWHHFETHFQRGSLQNTVSPHSLCNSWCNKPDHHV